MPGESAGLEQALGRVEQDVDTALKAAEKLVKTLRQIKQAAQLGELRKMQNGIEGVRQSIGTLGQEIESVGNSWSFDDSGYLRGGDFSQELLAVAREQGVQISEQDDRLYCYPMLITLDPARQAVLIDRKPERRLRPSVLVGILRDRQKRPPRFRPAGILEALHTAYVAATQRRKAGDRYGSVIQLVDLYALLTMLPDVGKEYGIHEFTRDIYLLDQSGVTTTKDGSTMALHASTGTRSSRGVLSIVTQNGAEKRYYGISFAHPGGA